MTANTGRRPRLAVDLLPALAVTRREIKDTLRDWRIVMPITLLVVTFPVLATLVGRAGVNYVNQYGAEIIVERLFPFLMLVVGFFPSTFSLVIALETFVGEKERRSLEPLLSTPLTDFQLYLGKLLAAIVPPVLASYVGMGTYTLMLGFVVGWWPGPSLLLLGFSLATAKAVVMVAGAVIVSSQSTSVRAANLVASFIIVPMALLLQVEASLLLVASYGTLWMVLVGLLVVTALLVRLGIRIFNREQLLGRDLDQLDLRLGLRKFWEAVWPRSGLLGFYRRELPSLVRGMRPEVVMTLLAVVVGGAAVGGYLSDHFALPLAALDLAGVPAEGAMDDLVAQSGLLPAFTTWAVFVNNVRSLALAAVVGFLSLGTLALMLLMAPMVIVAYIGMQIGRIGIDPWAFLAVTVLPHGVFELPAAILATAQAMRIGDVILTPPDKGGGVFGIVRELGHWVKLMVLVVAPLLLIAAWIEVNVTPGLLVRFLGQLAR